MSLVELAQLVFVEATNVVVLRRGRVGGFLGGCEAQCLESGSQARRSFAAGRGRVLVLLRRSRHRRCVAVVIEGGRGAAVGIVVEGVAAGASTGVVSGGATKRGRNDGVHGIVVVGGGVRVVDIDAEVNVGRRFSPSSCCDGGATWNGQLGDAAGNVGEAQKPLADRILPMMVVFVVVNPAVVEVVPEQSHGCLACSGFTTAAAAIDDARGYDSRWAVGADGHNSWRLGMPQEGERRGGSALG